jgi:hypothetical protein
LENKKWRIPRGDAHSIELTNLWMGEMSSIGWIDGKVQSVGDHDDSVMACWICNCAIVDGNPTMDFIDAGERSLAESNVLAAPVPAEGLSEYAKAERMALAKVSNGHAVDCDRDQYLARVRSSLHQFAGECVDGGNQHRAVTVLEEIKRLDKKFNFRPYDANYIPSNIAKNIDNTTQVD